MANWIAGATSKNKGAFKKSAEHAGMSTSAYANKVAASPNASPTQKKRANLAKVLIAMHRRKKLKKAGKAK